MNAVSRTHWDGRCGGCHRQYKTRPVCQETRTFHMPIRLKVRAMHVRQVPSHGMQGVMHAHRCLFLAITLFWLCVRQLLLFASCCAATACANFEPLSGALIPHSGCIADGMALCALAQGTLPAT